MSESTSTPAPAGVSDVRPAIAPPPASQPAISVTDAARLLRQQRRATAPEGAPAASQPADRRPSANEVAQAAQKSAAGSDQSAALPQSKAAPAGLSAMERALGVPGVAPPAAANGATAPAPESSNGSAAPFTIEVEGRRLTSAAEVQEFARLKSADYTQKSQELAQQRQQLQAQQQALAQVLPYIQPELQRLAESLQRAEPTAAPDLALAESDPAAYVRQLAQYNAAVAEQQRLGSLTAIQQQAQARAIEQMAATAHEQLAKEFPFWADPAERQAAQQQIVTWATTLGGFTKDELRNLVDPRQLKTMMKASMYDRWVTSAKTSAPVPTLAAPPRGSAPPAPPTVRVAEAEQAFSSNPSIKAGAALLAARRGAQR